MRAARWLVLAALALVALGCAAEGQPAAAPNPARLAIAATQTAMVMQADLWGYSAEATQQAMATQSAADAAQAELRVTEQAFGLQVTQTAQAFADAERVADLTATALAAEERAQQLAVMEVARQATATAITAAAAERVSQQQQAEVMANLMPALYCLGGGLLVGLTAWGLYEWIRVLVDRRRYVETSAGPVYLLSGGDAVDLGPVETPDPQPQPVTVRPVRAAQTGVSISPGGVVATSGPRVRNPLGAVDEYTLVRRFLRNASAAAGAQSTKLPRYDAMGWHSKQWQRAVRILEEQGAVVAVPREGTYINTERYPTLGALTAAVYNRR